MGRPYEAELLLLAATYDWALRADIETLSRTISTLRGLPLVVVGSGGSLSGCVFAARLHETHARLPVHALTPLEFIRHPAPQAAGVLLLSAGGSNPDVLAAAEHAIASEYASTVGLCTRTDTLLKARLAKYRHTTVFEFEGPSKKDGFLATNSLLLMCTLLARAYGVELPERLPALDSPLTDLALGEALDRPHVLALADGWAGSGSYRPRIQVGRERLWFRRRDGRPEFRPRAAPRSLPPPRRHARPRSGGGRRLFRAAGRE